MILHEKTKIEFGYEFATATIRSEFYCICDYCGQEFKRCKKTIVQCNKVIGKDSCGVGNCKKLKSEDVQLLKFGVRNVGGSEESVKKRKATCESIYGNEEYNRTDLAKERNRETCGKDYPMQTDSVKQKVKDKKQLNWGVDHHTKSPKYQKIRRERSTAKRGVDHHSKTQEFKDKLRATFEARYNAPSIFQSDYYINLVKDDGTNHYGKTQKNIKEFIQSLGYEFTPDRTLLSGKEIDLYNDELGIGIEYCGLFWHHEFSPQPRTRSYHYDKYRTCQEKSVKLITIFEDEWKFKPEICKSILMAALGKSEKIFARKCVVKSLEKNDVLQFCNQYHLRESPKSVLFASGLYRNDELIAIMSLGKHHRKSQELVLNRLCFKPGIQVVGGSSKLLSCCEKWCVTNKYERLISWSDNRWSQGNVYGKMGFTLEKELMPDYSYVLLGGGKVVRLSKQSCRKKAQKCPPEKTEREWMAEKGYARIWDCGKKRWVKQLIPT